MNVCTIRNAAIGSASLAMLMSVAPGAVSAGDWNGRPIANVTVYIQPGDKLYYMSNFSIYTTTKHVLQVKGVDCLGYFCEVVLNGVNLYAWKSQIKFDPPEGKPVDTHRTLRLGDVGVDVRSAQQALAKLGHSIAVDGKYGSSAQKPSSTARWIVPIRLEPDHP